MNKLLLIINIFIFIGACTHKPPLSQLKKETTQILIDFTRHHLKYLNKPAPKIAISMVPYLKSKNRKILAACRSKPKPHILIKQEVWESISYEEKEYVLFHELGHCILKRNHNNKKNNGNPVSIMNSSYSYKFLSPYINNKEKYIKELFRFY